MRLEKAGIYILLDFFRSTEPPSAFKELKQNNDGKESSPNKWFHDENNGCVQAFQIIEHFVTVHCKTTTQNDQLLRIFKNVGHDSKFFAVCTKSAYLV